MCRLVEHRAQQGVATFGHPALVVDLAGLVALWRQADMCADRPGMDEALRLIDRRTVSQRYHCADPWGGHQPPAHQVGTDHVEQHLVQHGELLAHDPADAEQRLDNHGQPRKARDEFADPRLVSTATDDAYFQTEIAQRAAVVSSIRCSWATSVFTCTGLNRPTRIICAIPRASLRSVLLICCAVSKAAMCRVSTQITGSSAATNALTSHCDSGPASIPIRPKDTSSEVRTAMISAGSVCTFCSKITLPASSTTHTDVVFTDTSRPAKWTILSLLPRGSRPPDLNPLLSEKGDAHSSAMRAAAAAIHHLWAG